MIALFSSLFKYKIMTQFFFLSLGNLTPATAALSLGNVPQTKRTMRSQTIAKLYSLALKINIVRVHRGFLVATCEALAVLRAN